MGRRQRASFAPTSEPSAARRPSEVGCDGSDVGSGLECCVLPPQPGTEDLNVDEELCQLGFVPRPGLQSCMKLLAPGGCRLELLADHVQGRSAGDGARREVLNPYRSIVIIAVEHPRSPEPP